MFAPDIQHIVSSFIASSGVYPPSCLWSRPACLRIRRRSCTLFSVTPDSICSTKPASTASTLLLFTPTVTDRDPPSSSPTTLLGLFLERTPPRTTPRASRVSTMSRRSSTASVQGKTGPWGWPGSADRLLSPMYQLVLILVLWCSCIGTNLSSCPTQEPALSFRLKQCTEATWCWLNLKCIVLKVCDSEHFLYSNNRQSFQCLRMNFVLFQQQ